MIFLILFICLGAAFSGYAEKSSEYLVQTTAKESLNEGAERYDLNHKPVALVTHSNLRRTASISHRHLSYSRFVDILSPALLSKQPSNLQEFFEPDVYFKPIGLKLVFPEHYFW